MNDLTELWEKVNSPKKRLTYDSLADLMSQRFQQKYTGPNLGQLIKGTAKSPSLDTKNQIRTILKEQLGISESVERGRVESADSHVELRDHPGESDLAIWKRRAIESERKLANLRAGLRLMLDGSATTPPPISSKLTAVEEDILDEASKPATGSTSKSKH